MGGFQKTGQIPQTSNSLPPAAKPDTSSGVGGSDKDRRRLVRNLWCACVNSVENETETARTLAMDWFAPQTVITIPHARSNTIRVSKFRKLPQCKLTDSHSGQHVRSVSPVALPTPGPKAPGVPPAGVLVAGGGSIPRISSVVSIGTATVNSTPKKSRTAPCGGCSKRGDATSPSQ